ncbi:ribonuclease-like protein H [Calycina marina]|uniref:Ribonuclease H n=1 Tax=Calycina marina TaxID=1763456 RepID=A0A9P7Z6E3_9HELO|nr:ribonuclease-like protein H [Calycina marina]
MSSGSKKRKLDEGVQKYYAVKAGHTISVFEDWSKCQESITGYKGAVFKSFTTEQDAKDFVAGKAVKSSTPKEPRFYGVAIGKVPGVYEEWTEAQEQIAGVKGPKYKKFATRKEAEAFVEEHDTTAESKVTTTLPQPSSKRAKIAETSKRKDMPSIKEVKVYTDGSSLGNGKIGAQAGVGVFFGDNDRRNVSEPLQGTAQTNQRAELTAVLRALEIVPLKDNIRIITDSNYSINCVTVWYKSWAKNGWQNSKHQDVMNQDIIRSIRALIERRDAGGAQTSFEWIKGHSNHPSNEAADKLAVAGARRSDGRD